MRARGAGSVRPAFGGAVSTADRRQANLFYADLIWGRRRRRADGVLEAQGEPSEELDTNDARRKTFREMWDLIVKFRWRETPPLYTNELVTAICWEESTFMNIWQEGLHGARGPAKGFGQLEPSALAIIRTKFGFTQSVAELQRLMDADAFSVSFVCRALHSLHDNLSALHPNLRSDEVRLKRTVLLHGYAGYSTDHAQWRVDVVDGWYAAERELVAGRGPNGYPTRSAAQRALDAATPPKRKMRGPAWQEFLAQICQSLPDP